MAIACKLVLLSMHSKHTYKLYIGDSIGPMIGTYSLTGCLLFQKVPHNIIMSSLHLYMGLIPCLDAIA